MDGRRFFAVMGAVNVALAFIGWLCNWPSTATLWVGGLLIMAVAARQ